MSSNTFNKIIKENHYNYDIQINPPNVASNHLPHDLTLMHKHGATSEQLEKWFNTYKQIASGYGKLHEIKGTKDSINKDNWKSLIGTSNWAGWISFFDNELESNGIENTLGFYLQNDNLGSAVSSYLIHGLISIGYGLECNSNYIISEGLAQIAWKYNQQIFSSISLHRLESCSSLNDLINLSNSIKDDNRIIETKNNLSLSDNIDLNDDKFSLIKDLEEQFNLGPCKTQQDITDILKILSNWAFYILGKAGGRDFALLHLITSTLALKNICLLLPEYSISIIRHWIIMGLKMYIIKGLPNTEIQPKNIYSWDELCQKAFNHYDEHTVKGVLISKDSLNNNIIRDDLKPTVKAISEILLEIPSPPEKGDKEIDWIYPSTISPYAII